MLNKNELRIVVGDLVVLGKCAGTEVEPDVLVLSAADVLAVAAERS